MGGLSVPDLIITIAYFSIPLQIVFSLIQYPRLTEKIVITKIVVLLVLFALFIFLCGAGHLMRCLERADTTLFRVINITTAVVSLVTAVYLIPMLPNLVGSLDKSLLDLARTTKIVDSMYPASVRDKLLTIGSGRHLMKGRSCSHADSALALPHVEESTDGVTKGKRTFFRRFSDHLNSTERLKDFLRSRRSSTTQPDFDVRANIDSGVEGSAPIAESFEGVSIMFADLVGFTAWSSAHTPNNVFTLLESIFWEFDEIAREMNVFKISTIGDCYLAATGLPDPREDHALVLAKFAERCRRKANEITQDLALDLGGDTANLSLRFGLHSGPVTAGVLRGQKSRFELFGDTINTASRMESTGAPDRIQISKETANLLREGGKEDWLDAREGLVEAKGKGELQTYWLRVDLPEDDGYEHDEPDLDCVI